MTKVTLDLPRMYGDHHVVEVRRLVLDLPGVQEVYASSAFRVLEVVFDPALVSEEEITRTLDEAGYLGEMEFPTETGVAAYQTGNGNAFFRHTQSNGNAKQVVRFARQVKTDGQSNWPCPGMGVVRMED